MSNSDKTERIFHSLIRRSTLANVVAASAVAGGLLYFALTKDSESMKWLVAFGAGWLFKEVTKPSKD